MKHDNAMTWWEKLIEERKYLRSIGAPVDDDEELAEWIKAYREVLAMPDEEVRGIMERAVQNAIRQVEAERRGDETAATEPQPNLDALPPTAGCEEQPKGILDRVREQVESRLLELEVALVSLSDWLTGRGFQASPVLAGIKQDNMLGPEETTQAISSEAVIPLANIDEKRQLEKVPWVGTTLRIVQVPNPADAGATMCAAAVDVVRNASRKDGALRISLMPRTGKMQGKAIAVVELTAAPGERTKTFSMAEGESMHLALGDLEARITVLERVQP